MNRYLKFFLTAVAAFVSVLFFMAYQPTEPPVSTRTFVIPHVDPNRDYSFAGERVPTENFDVKERFERELIINSYLHSTVILNLKNSTRYFPVIEKMLKENGIPEDFKYVAVAESNFRNTAHSSAGAKGVWQFMPATAPEYGLEVSDEVDERLHLEKSTQAACEYLKKRYARFGNWTLAAASFNMGASGLAGDMAEQRIENYYDLNLSEETNRYIFRVLAIKEVLERPMDFGFDLAEEHQYEPMDDFKLVQVNTSIESLGDFAKEHGTTYRMLKLYNPWLRGSKLTNRKGKVYEVKVPKN